MDTATEKGRLISATLLDMMEEKSCFHIKVTDLAKRAGISRSGFYTYFDSILDVVEQLENDYIDDLPDISNAAENTGVSLRYRQEGLIDWTSQLSYWTYLHDNMRTYKILSGQNGEPLFRHKLENRFVRISLSIFKDAAPKADPLACEAAARYCAGARLAIHDWWSFHSDEIDAETIQQLTGELYWKTLDTILHDVL